LKQYNRTNNRFFRTFNRWAAFEFLFAPVKLMKRSELKISNNLKAKLEYEMSINFRKLFSFAEVNVEEFPSEPSTEVT